MNILTTEKDKLGILSKRAKPVYDIFKYTHLYDVMRQVLYEQGGIGLAAPQLGLSIRCISYRPTTDSDDLVLLFNPQILKRRGSVTLEESCLSIPNYKKTMIRSATIRVQAITMFNQMVQLNYTGLEAVIIQHEVDHLNGILINSFDIFGGV